MEFNLHEYILESKYSPLSLSKLGTYDCPEKFKYKYIDKIKKPFDGSIHFEKGKYLHSMIENTLSTKFGSLVNNIYSPNPIHCNNEDINNWQQVMSKFMESRLLLDIIEELSAANKIGIEEYIALLNKNIEPSSYSDYDGLFNLCIDDWESNRLKYLKLGGYTDLFYITKDKLVLIDWKSGKSKVFNFTQLSLYIYLLNHRYDLSNLKIQIRYVYIDRIEEDSKTYENVEMFIEDNLEILEGIKNRIKKMQEDTEFLPKMPDRNCYWCDFKEECTVYNK